MNDLNTLQNLSTGMGLELPSLAYIMGSLLFGILGLAAYRWGKKRQRPYHRWMGLALMLFPYLVHDTWAMYVVGGLMCVSLYFLPG